MALAPHSFANEARRQSQIERPRPGETVFMTCWPLLISMSFDYSVVGKRFEAGREQIA